MTTTDTDLARLRRDRNRFGVSAVVVIAISLAIALPRKLAQYRELKRLNDEIVSLQRVIGAANDQIRDIQVGISWRQQEISRTLHP